MSAAALLKNGVQDKCYPTPLATHENVIKDSSLFWDTLRNFHSLMGTKYMVPVIGGRELNLHVLYGEVTRRGGYDQVVKEKQWREVSSVFNFSPSTTSASYALRKHYFSLLYHYEQLYFFKLQSPLNNSSLSPPPSDPCTFEAIGTIDGKFDCGYLVSVKLGSETLNGVLYHPDPAEQPILPKQAMNIVPYNLTQPSSGYNNPMRRRSRRRRRGNGDPNRPKPNRSGYNFFFAEKHSKLKASCPEKEREFTKMIGESWNKLTKEEKSVYQEQGEKDRERYQREMVEYRESIRIKQS